MAFAGCRVFVSLPGAEAWFLPQSVPQLLAAGGAKVVASPAEATHLLARCETQDDSVQLKLQTLANPGVHLCSLTWFFGCRAAGRPLAPGAHPLYSPFPADTIPGAAGFGAVTFTSFTGIERVAVKVLSLAAGLRFDQAMHYPTAPGVSDAADPDRTVLVIAKDVAEHSQKADVAR